MMRPWNWSSRRLSSLVTVVMSTMNRAPAMEVPATVIDPVTWLVRPTATLLYPKRVSLTR